VTFPVTSPGDARRLKLSVCYHTRTSHFRTLSSHLGTITGTGTTSHIHPMLPNMRKFIKKIRSKAHIGLPGQSSESIDVAPTPSPSPISRPSSSSRDAILAFRTITFMLSLIQSPTAIINPDGKEDLSKDQRYELKVLDSLAAVVVRQHEIVAVMAKSYNGSNLEVVASVDNVDLAVNTPQHTVTTQSPVDSDWTKKRLRWFITPNPRYPQKGMEKDSLRTSNPSMTLVNPNESISDELSNLKASPDALLNVFLATEWWVFWCFPTIKL
jgi:hypothetical protein